MRVNINQELSPIKFLVLFVPSDEEKIINIIRSLNSIWSGLNSPIFPYYKDFDKAFIKRYNLEIYSNDFYINTINNYDPDVIVYDELIDSEFLNNISFDRSVIKLDEFIDRVKKNQLKYSIGIDILIEDIFKNEFKYKRTDDLKLSIPKIKNNDLFLSAWIGNVVDEIHENLIKKHLIDEEWYEDYIIDYENLDDFLKENLLSTGQILRHEINSLNKNHNQYILFVFDSNNWKDVLDYWNLRAIGLKVLAIPHNRIKEKVFIDKILYFLDIKKNSNLQFNHLDIVITNDLNDNEILEEIELILKEMKSNTLLLKRWFPRFWDDDKEILRYDSVICPKFIFEFYDKETKIDETDLLTIELPFLPFETNISNDALFKSYLSLSFWNNEGKYAGVISDISTKDWYKITKSYTFSSNWRINNDGIVKYIRNNKETESFYLPKSFDFFSKYFSKKGFQIIETSSTKLAREVLNNLGGIHGTNILSSQKSIEIIELFEGGKPVSFEELLGNIKRLKPFPEIKEPQDFIQILLDKKIIEFGVNIKCDICEQKSFYLINDLEENIQCSICRNSFPLPQNNPKETFKYAYRGLGSFSRNNKVDGLLCVFLTIRLFNLELTDSDREISFIMDFDIKDKKNKYEVDLAIISKHFKNRWIPFSFICECKTFKSFTEVDLERLKYLGSKLPNVVLVVATLKNEFNEDEKKLLINLVSTFRDEERLHITNPILLLTSNELIPENRHFSLKQYNKLISKYEHVNYIQELADLTCKKHLNIRTMSDLVSEHSEKKA